MRSAINRQPAGTPIGGQFAAIHRAGPALVLQDEAQLADIDAIAAQIPKLWERQQKAERKAAMFELANIAQIAYEHGHSRDSCLVIDSHARRVLGVDEDDKVREAPQWWSEDLAKVDRDVLVDLPGVHADTASQSGDRWTMQIGTALDAERRLLGRQAENPIGYAGRRDRAWEAASAARSEHIRAVLHAQVLQMRRADERTAVLTFTPSAWDDQVLSIDEVYDADGDPICDEAYDYLEELGSDDCFFPNFSADHLRAAGVAADGPRGELIVHVDRLARMRGAAEDPNQASLFGKDKPTDYGWRAAA